jgi:hypothetical protein
LKVHLNVATASQTAESQVENKFGVFRQLWKKTDILNRAIGAINITCSFKYKYYNINTDSECITDYSLIKIRHILTSSGNFRHCVHLCVNNKSIQCNQYIQHSATGAADLINFFLLINYHPIPRWDSISRPITPQAETKPLDHAARA